MSINLTLGLLDIESTHIALVSPPLSVSLPQLSVRFLDSERRASLRQLEVVWFLIPSDCLPCGHLKSLWLLPTWLTTTWGAGNQRERCRLVNFLVIMRIVMFKKTTSFCGWPLQDDALINAKVYGWHNKHSKPTCQVYLLNPSLSFICTPTYSFFLTHGLFHSKYHAIITLSINIFIKRNLFKETKTTELHLK